MGKKFETQKIVENDSAALNFLYKTTVGRIMLKPLIQPTVSKLAGYYLNHKASKKMIKRFIYKNKISMEDYQTKDFSSFNDFFIREIKTDARPFPKENNLLVAPCDGKLTLYPIQENNVFQIKKSFYGVKELIGDLELNTQWIGGTAAIFRLTPDDYHHYYFIDEGKISNHQKIDGKFHTVRPIAINEKSVFTQNTRECSIIETTNFGSVAQIEVGALLVGKIKNKKINGTCQRFEKKGWFEFGGSTVILLFQKDKINFEPEIIKNSLNKEETIVRLGQQIGEVKK